MIMNPNPNPKPTTNNEHAIMRIQQNTVTCPRLRTHPEKFTRDSVAV